MGAERESRSIAIPNKIYLTTCPTQAGWIGLVASPKGLVALEYPRPTKDEALAWLRERWPKVPLVEDSLLEAKAQLRRYFAGQVVAFQVKLDLEGYTLFQRRVWLVTHKIPYGQTRTYSRLAQEIGSPHAFRAVGQALATNPIPIIIPCHRVIREDGSLGGYGGGLELKRRLLEMEREPRPS